jgi:hypothetical protein
MTANQRPFVRALRKNGFALLMTAGLFAIMYAVVFRFRYGTFTGGYGFSTGDSDYIDHMVWAIALTPKAMLASFYDGSDYLWHICVKLLFMAGVSNTWKAAAIVTAAANAAAYFLVYKTWETVLPEKFPRSLTAVLIAAIFLVNALTLPGGDVYAGRAAVNTWHNPTNIMVRPFAAAVFYMTVRIYARRRYGSHTIVPTLTDGQDFTFSSGFFSSFREPVYTGAELILYPLCILFSAYAKPSFLQFFAPAIFLFLLVDVIRTKGRLLPFCIKLALAYVPAALILLSQFTSFFSGGITVDTTAAAAAAETVSEASGVAIYFIQQSFSGVGEFISSLFHQIWILLCVCAWPIFVLCLGGKVGMRDPAARLSITGVLTAWLEVLLLHETGSRADHGNFTWGFYLSLWLFWGVAMGRYLTALASDGPRKRLALWVGIPLLGCHLAAGIFYVIHIYQTSQYLF